MKKKLNNKKLQNESEEIKKRDGSVTMDQVREEFAKIITPHLLRYMYEQQQAEANKTTK